MKKCAIAKNINNYRWLIGKYMLWGRDYSHYYWWDPMNHWDKDQYTNRK